MRDMERYYSKKSLMKLEISIILQVMSPPPPKILYFSLYSPTLVGSYSTTLADSLNARNTLFY